MRDPAWLRSRAVDAWFALLSGRDDCGEMVGEGYPTLYFTIASAKQRPGTSMGGLQFVLNFRSGAICAGTCKGALSFKWGFAFLSGSLSPLFKRLAICWENIAAVSVPDLKRAVASEGMTWCTAIELVMPTRKVNECNVIVLISMMLPTRTAKPCLEVLSACETRRMHETQRSAAQAPHIPLGFARVRLRDDWSPP